PAPGGGQESPGRPAGGTRSAPADALGSHCGNGASGDPGAPRAMLGAMQAGMPVGDSVGIAVAPAPDLPAPRSFDEVVALFGARREGILQAHLRRNVHLVRFEHGRLEFRPSAQAPRDLAARVGQKLSEWTGRRWVIAISAEPGAPSLLEQREEAERQERAEAA